MGGVSASGARVIDPADTAGAYDFCLQLVSSRSGGLRVGLRFVAGPTRRHVAALYAFVRIANDFADEPEYEGVRRERLEDWGRQLWAIGGAPPQHPVFLALEKTIAELSLPKEPFAQLLSASQQDCAKGRYETEAELLDYCRRSADPIGRLVLMIHGYREEELFKLSDGLCTALQLTSLLRDVGTDLQRDRIYLPGEDFKASGYTEADLRMGVVNERYRDLFKIQWKRARAQFEAGRELPGRLSWPLDWDARLAWLGGMEILRKVHKLGYDVVGRRPSITLWDWMGLVLKALAKR
jgi:squalene synthase HpnC